MEERKTNYTADDIICINSGTIAEMLNELGKEVNTSNQLKRMYAEEKERLKTQLDVVKMVLAL